MRGQLGGLLEGGRLLQASRSQLATATQAAATAAQQNRAKLDLTFNDAR
jgi:hypothetical protein